MAQDKKVGNNNGDKTTGAAAPSAAASAPAPAPAPTPDNIHQLEAESKAKAKAEASVVEKKEAPVEEVPVGDPAFASDNAIIGRYVSDMAPKKPQTEVSIKKCQHKLFDLLQKIINTDSAEFNKRWGNLLTVIGDMTDVKSPFYLRAISRGNDGTDLKMVQLACLTNIILTTKLSGKDKVASLLNLEKDLSGVANEIGLGNMAQYYE